MRRYAKVRFADCLSILLVGLLAAGVAADQHESAPVDEPIQLQELVVVGVGTRGQGRTVTDSPVPVDVVTEQEIIETGEAEVGRIIQALIPSFNFSSSTISDGTDSVRPATLRGMQPDQVLVLVNGKRRHGSALIHVNRSVGRGTAGTDLNAIPVSAIKRIEVLRDGASAQYGSDAIAGVINIILKDSYDGALHTSAGQTYESDGTRYTVRLNKGFQIGEDGVLHAALEFSQRGATNRAGLTAQPQYSGSVCNLGECTADQLDPARKIALQQRYGDDVRVLLDNPAGEQERRFQPRRNFRIGDSELDQVSGAFNYSNPIDELGAEVYAFGDFSRVQNESGGFYRRANEPKKNPQGSIYPDGFLPLINTTIMDFSVGGGILREFENSIKADLAVVHGGNSFNFEVMNSQNASWVNCAVKTVDPTNIADIAEACSKFGDTFSVSDTPTSADAGALRLDLTTVNLDFSWPLLDNLHLAWGAEYRLDRYRIEAGEPYSYEDYDGGVTGATGGIQVFPGFGPIREVDETRNAFSLYVDTEFYLSESLLVSPAVRFENFSDFGSTINGKLAAKLDLSAQFAVRGSVSSGFRAPSMQQLYFNSVSTQFVTDEATDQVVARQIGTFRNNSQIAKDIRIPELEQETSINVSGGFVFQPVPSLTLTTDFYHIEVADRIIVSGSLKATDTGLPGHVRDALSEAGINEAQFFMNAADTRTQGVDVVAVWDVPFVQRGDLALKLLGTASETTITSVNLPASLPSSLFEDRERSVIEEWQPKHRFTLSGSYRLDRFSFLLALHGYGPYTVSMDGNNPAKQRHDAKYLTDLQLGYNLGFGTLRVGANNMFDVTPDENEIELSRNGTIIDAAGNVIVDSPGGVFTYSRRSAPFGFNGGFYYVAFDVDF